MAKRLFLLTVGSFIGVTLMAQGFLMKSEAFTLNGVGEVQTIEKIEMPEKVEPEISSAPALAVQARQTVAQVGGRRASASVNNAPANSIQITGRTIAVVDVADTTVNAGDHVNKYGSRFLYGHNSAAVFGGLSGLGVGSTFSVTYGGVTTNYRVAKIVTFEKNESTGELQLNGSGDYMLSVSRARSNGVQYDLSLMTCAGKSLGNGKATHRLVIFANAL